MRGPGKSNSRRTGGIGLDEAEELTGITSQQVSKWAAKLEHQAEFVAWWREKVRGPGKVNSRRTGLIDCDDAEELTGISQQQVSKWAERRLGELIAEQKRTVGLNRGLAGSRVSGSEKEPVKDDRPTLAAAGIDKKLSSRAQKLAAVPEPKFEGMVAHMRQRGLR